MNPTRVARPEMCVVGVEVRTKNALEANPATAKIGGLWKGFFQEGLAEKIANRKDPTSVLGVYTNYEGDHAGFYTLIIGVEVQGSRAIPNGMVGITIPAAQYLVFPAPGKMPEAVITAWGNVWKYFVPGAPYERAYTTDFELYGIGGGGQTQVEIYIAMK